MDRSLLKVLRLQSMLVQQTPFPQQHLSSSSSQVIRRDELRAFHGARLNVSSEGALIHAPGRRSPTSPRGSRLSAVFPRRQRLLASHQYVVCGSSFCRQALMVKGNERRCAQGTIEETDGDFLLRQKRTLKVLAAQQDGVCSLPFDDCRLPSGSIHLIVGPMFAGKTTALLQRVEEEASAGRKVALVKSDKDTRYGLSSIVSHGGKSMPCLAVPNLASFRTQIGEEEYAKLELIGIDEAQFLRDLYSFCQAAADYEGKTLIVAGLDGDYERKKFGSILDLVPLADSIIKLHSYCELCGKPASFTFRKTDNTTKEVIGGNDIYMPVCRQHYYSGKVAIEATRTVLNSGKVAIEATRPIIKGHNFLTLPPDKAENTVNLRFDTEPQ